MIMKRPKLKWYEQGYHKRTYRPADTTKICFLCKKKIRLKQRFVFWNRGMLTTVAHRRCADKQKKQRAKKAKK